MLQLVALHSPVTTRVGRWSTRAQQRACRNAMVASTALSQARRERAEVEEYVVGTLARRSPEPLADPLADPLAPAPETPTGT